MKSKYQIEKEVKKIYKRKRDYTLFKKINYYDFDDTPLEKFITNLQNIKDSIKDELIIRIENSDYSGSVNLSLYFYNLESDEDYEKRLSKIIEQQLKYEQTKENNERKEYERLKKKYDKQSKTT